MDDHTDKEERVEDAQAADRSSRRKLLKAGVYLVPAIVTLRARAAFGAPGEIGDPIKDLNRNYQTNTYQFEYGTENNKGKTTFEAHNIDLSTGTTYGGQEVWQEYGGGPWHTWSN